MRLIVLLILLLSLSFSPSLKAERLVVYQMEFKDGGKKKFKKRKYQKRRFVKGQKKLENQLKIPVEIFQVQKRTKGGAILMAILTGPLGGHRLYLGTEPHVPIVYTLTLGGGMGLLPAIDIVMILVSKDISKYENNPQIIMWGN